MSSDTEDLKNRSDYEADAISALVQFNPKYSTEAWETEVATYIEEEQCDFKTAVYLALVENYQDNQGEPWVFPPADSRKKEDKKP